MFKNMLIPIFVLSLFIGCGLMNKSKNSSQSPQIVYDDNRTNGKDAGLPTAVSEGVASGIYKVDDIEILAQEILFIPKLLVEIDEVPNIFIKEGNVTKLNEKYSFDNYTLLSGDIKYLGDKSMILNMRLVDNRYSITKEYLNYKFNFINGNEKSIYPISGQEVINNHTFLLVHDNKQTAMKFDNMNNLLTGGLFRYFNQNKSEVVFEAIGINELKIFVDKNLNNIFEEEEITHIILGEL